ncbi:hypothetical protein CAPTEDRAFT_201790 [Capitella teleta]|uniref:Phosphodiesterase n=1 Tax=Capitella teleta TaxID=283909 RepID=R7U408_CAPTE|nr:hypothetical protein CAPTEDRAFT_201790 [Capitella teleta]|eukprot:ELU01080.1 hypothetical protein CAPTEDRAFT_201790 [Capitella teleta]
MGCAPSIHVSQTSGVVLCSDNEDSTVSSNNHQVASAAVLLVFAKQDAQSECFRRAADRCRCSTILVRSPEAALESYLAQQHDLVIIDNRSRTLDAEALCRSLRATKANEHAVYMAVTKKLSSDKEELSVIPFINAGFSRRFSENTNVSICQNELLLLEHGEVRLQRQLSAAMAFHAAAENCMEAIEITSDEHEIQYVNPAHERLFGYSNDESMGRNSREIGRTEASKTDSSDCMNGQLRKGKSWEGTCHMKKKSGENFSFRCHTTPVGGLPGFHSHLSLCVSLSVLLSFKIVLLQKYSKIFLSVSRLSQVHLCMNRFCSLPPCFSPKTLKNPKLASFARIHSMMIEAPITKVINIINAAQENSPNTVVQALDRVLDILRSSELYSPHLKMKEDPVTNDLVGGLMTTHSRRYSALNDATLSKNSAAATTGPVAPPSTPSTQLAHVSPELQQLLETEPNWDFDIGKLEKLTSGRPLVYLGLKTFQRFDVLDFLQVGEKQMAAWLQVMEVNYHSANSYHNSTHAADVMHATAYFLSQDRCKSLFEPMDVVAALLAAVIHDLDHPGKTNSYLVNAGSELAILYNDIAVLESHHASMAFHLSQDKNVNIFSNLSREDFRSFRQQVIDMVLATEMTKHFEHLNKFIGSINQVSAKDEEMSQMNRMLVKRMLIKCADVSNPARPLPLCKMWAERIANEYCDQTEEEKKLGLPVVMPVFDRRTCNVPKTQIGFIDFFINDMFDAWDAFCDVPLLIQFIKDNYTYWKDQEQQLAAAAAANQIEVNLSRSSNTLCCVSVRHPSPTPQ